MDKLKILILGANGMLGHAILRHVAERGVHQITGVVRSASAASQLPAGLQARLAVVPDLDQDHALRSLLKDHRPDVVVNCIGLIKQLQADSSVRTAIEINALLPHRLAALCRESGARLVHFSTDCVFAGDTGGYLETDCADATDVYGRTKWLGEVHDSHAITLRTSIIGEELASRHSLIGWFLSQEGTVPGYSRAVFSGLPTVEIARVLHDHVLPRTDLSGLYHLSADPIDKYHLLQLVAAAYDKTVAIEEDRRVVIDRSLDSSRFRSITGYQAPSWPDLVGQMRRFHSCL